MINTLALIGVGLIGGSVAKAVKARGLCQSIRGYDRSQDNLSSALELGVIDFAHTSAGDAAKNAEIVLIAVPVGACASVFDDLATVWRPDAVYTDVGSTKQSVLRALEVALGRVPTNFIAGHPIAGAELSGVQAANADLFDGRRVILTPQNDAEAEAIARIRALWECLGARVSVMAPARHDKVLAATSHLPHVIAYTLTQMLGEKDEQEDIFQFAAGGFRDFSRIAGSDPVMWRDICLANAEEILPLIDELRVRLSRVSDLIANGRSEDLCEFLTSARASRQRFLQIFNAQ